MIRAVWITLMAGIAVCAVGAELDRASRREPALTAIVPGPFRSFAQERLTTTVVRSGTPEIAIETARTLVRRRPLPSEHLSLLAIAEERNGDRAGSGLLIQAAARRGWRDSIAQQAMFDIALGAGDPAEASRRLAALWSQNEDQVPLGDLTTRLLATPQGRQAMAETLKTPGRWQKAFLSHSSENMSKELAQTIAEANRAGARLDCKSLARLGQFYAGQKRADEEALVAGAVKNCANAD